MLRPSKSCGEYPASCVKAGLQAIKSPARSVEKTAIATGADRSKDEAVPSLSVRAQATGACRSEFRCAVDIQAFGMMLTQAGYLNREAHALRHDEGNPFPRRLLEMGKIRRLRSFHRRTAVANRPVPIFRYLSNLLKTQSLQYDSGKARTANYRALELSADGRSPRQEFRFPRGISNDVTGATHFESHRAAVKV